MHVRSRRRVLDGPSRPSRLAVDVLSGRSVVRRLADPVMRREIFGTNEVAR
jgi:hypothetical protein